MSEANSLQTKTVTFLDCKSSFLSLSLPVVFFILVNLPKREKEENVNVLRALSL